MHCKIISTKNFIGLKPRMFIKPSKSFHIYGMMGNILLTNYVQLLLYISYEQSELYMHVTTKAIFVATTRAQVNANRPIAM